MTGRQEDHKVTKYNSMGKKNYEEFEFAPFFNLRGVLPSCRRTLKFCGANIRYSYSVAA